MNKKDMFIKEKLQQDKEISDKANKIFENLKEEFIIDNNERKVITISFKKFLAIAASFVLVLFLGTNLYAHSLGKPNIFTAIKNLFNINEDDYNAAEENIDITVESNGLKLTLKTAAMDDNVLIVKYVAEGEKLVEEFYTYQEFEAEMIEYVKMLLTQAEWILQEDTYKDINGKDVMKALYSVRDRLYAIGLNEDETQELLDLASNAYIEYVAVQNNVTQDSEGNLYTEESAKEQIEQTIAMFESKVTSKYEIITSEDKLSEYKIEAIAQSIEKEESKYIIHAIYNVDTLVDILDEFDLNININKIGTIEGNWDYFVELNKAKLNKRVETIDFYNAYEVIIDSETEEQIEDFNLKVALKQLAISDFSSVLNIQTIKEQYYNKIDYTNLEKNIFPITFVVLDETGKVIGTSCQTREDAINAYPIVDRIILKGVDYNTEKIIVKMYSNIDNELIDTLDVDLKKAKKFMDTSLENYFYDAERGGIHFKYPKDWARVEVTDLTTLRIQSPENLDGDRAYFEVVFIQKTKDLTAEDEFKSLIEHPSNSNIEEKGKILIGFEGISGDYFVVTHDGEKRKIIIVGVNETETIYYMTFGGDEKVYAKYEPIFEKILKTVTFSEVTLWKELEEQDNSSNELEENTILLEELLEKKDDNSIVENEDYTTVLYGDVNCDGVVNNNDANYLAEYLVENLELSEQGKRNADVYKDGLVNGKDGFVLSKYLNNVEGYETLPYSSQKEVEDSYLETSMSWTKFSTASMWFEYPSVLNLNYTTNCNFLSHPSPGEVYIQISGKGTGFNANTKETMHANISIDIYEPLSKNEVDFEKLKWKCNYTTEDGLVWYEDYMTYEEGGYSYIYTCYRGSAENGYREYKISFASDVKHINFDNIITHLLNSVEFISY